MFHCVLRTGRQLEQAVGSPKPGFLTTSTFRPQPPTPPPPSPLIPSPEGSEVWFGFPGNNEEVLGDNAAAAAVATEVRKQLVETREGSLCLFFLEKRGVYL